MSLSVFHYCFCACLRRCRSFNPPLRRLSPFHLSYVAVSRPCRLSEFTLTGPHYKLTASLTAISWPMQESELTSVSFLLAPWPANGLEPITV